MSFLNAAVGKEIFSSSSVLFNPKQAGLAQPEGGGGIRPLCNFPFLRPMTAKFGGVILRQKLYQKIVKHLMTSLL